ncbi:MAG: hypothetical protein NTW28_08350, partial [Candidatus Solibacter sp.]|nr:hypothetical protein [Candidatus Solibacter sp.]
MRSFFDSKFAFIAVLSLFTFAFTWNMMHGTTATAGGHLLVLPDVTLVAHGPTIPPDPWDGVRIAHGPTIPPDPWDGVRMTA